MPDSRSHRGPHPEDEALFAPPAWPRLQGAVGDYSWLLSRGYGQTSAIKVVGDRHELNQRQRIAVMRSSCSDQALRGRQGRHVPLSVSAETPLHIDGFNLLTTIEVALGGGVVLHARDGCLRDIAGVHGTYRRVEETRPAVVLIGETLAAHGVAGATWYLDSPVGNSGGLKLFLLEIAAARGWNWRVEVVPNPDALLIRSDGIAATADSAILDRCSRWMNLVREVVQSRIQAARVIPMVPLSR